MAWLFLDGAFFWVFVLLISITLFGTVQSESPGWCSTIIGGALIALQLFSPYHPFSYLVHNPVNSIVVIAGYAFIGTVWSVIKWASYVHTLKDRYLDYKAEYISNHSLKTFEAYKADWISKNPIKVASLKRYDPDVVVTNPSPEQLALQDSNATNYANKELARPDEYARERLGISLPKTAQERSWFLRSRKGNIYMWITFWPFSAIGTIFDDPVRRFLRFVYSRLTGLLTGITERAFKNI